MPIPPLNKYGFLAVGTHLTSFVEIQETFVNSKQRKELWLRFLKFKDFVEGLQAFQAMGFYGSFFSNAEEPGDVDVVLELKPTGSPIAGVKKLFERDKLRNDYSVDVLLKETHAEPYRAMAPKDHGFTTQKLQTFRRLKRTEGAKVGEIDRTPPEMDKEYKGVLRVELIN